MAHMEYSHLFLNERIPAVSMEYHALKRQLIFLEGLGIRCSRIVYDVPIRMQDRKEAGQLLASCGIQPDAVYVAINPGAKWVTKLWEPGKFARVADDLIRRHSVRIIFTGSREDSAMVGAIRGRMKEPAAGVTGKTTLNVLSAIYENAACVLSTDTGPMHLAAAVGTPVVALFGPTAPSRTGPFGKRHRVLRTKMACSPCFKRECLLKRHGANVTALCMEQISVQDVIEAVEGRMDEMGKG